MICPPTRATPFHCFGKVYRAAGIPFKGVGVGAYRYEYHQ